MTHSVSRLLAPRSIAIVGGGAWGASILNAAKRIGFTGKLYFVHPQGKSLPGAISVVSLSDIDAPIDAAFVAVNRHASISIISQLSALDAGGAVCFASGFSEAAKEAEDGAALQANLIQAAGEMPILGPNCYGFLNAVDRVGIWPDQHGMTPVDRGVAILTQSSNIAINLTQQARALPISYMITCGNQAQTRQSDLALALLEDDRVSAVGLHIEGFGDLAAWDVFSRRAVEKNIPVVAIKAGRSEQARSATVSHTASLAGSDAGARAVLRRFGFGQVDDLSTFLETLKLLHVCGRLDSNSISSISCSGGEASLIADLAMDFDLNLPPLNSGQEDDLRRALGPMVALANPLDYHTYVWRDADAMTAAWRPMLAPHIGLTLSIVDYPRTDASDWTCATEAALSVRSNTGRPFALVASLPELMPEQVAQTLIDGCVAPLNGLREALAATEIASQTPSLEACPPASAAEELFDVQLIAEADAKKALARYGLDVPAFVQVPANTLRDVDGLTGPFAVKGVGLAHKTEANAVYLRVAKEDLADTVSAIPTSEVLIEEMVTDAVAELLVGVMRDPAHGFVLTIGAGGVFTELLQDSVALIVPSSRAHVKEALETLRLAPVLRGYRGKPKADMGAILDAVMAVQDYVVDHRDSLDEVEINPLIVTQDRAVAVDALIRKAKS